MASRGDEAAILVLTAAIGFPIPPTLALSLIKTFAGMVGAACEVPKAWLDGKARVIRARADAEVAVLRKMPSLVTSEIKADSDLSARATAFLGGRMLREQVCREAVFRSALAELAANPPAAEPERPIDADWLDMFSRHAQTKNTDEMRVYFGRVLSGELRQPGAFSPATIEVLARLTSDIADQFRQLCNISGRFVGNDDELAFVLAEPFGDPGGNDLAQLGFSFSALGVVQDAGLVRPELNGGKDMPLHAFADSTFEIAGLPVPLTEVGSPKDALRDHRLLDANNARPHRCIFFSTAGQELRRIVDMQPNGTYVERFLAWAKSRGLEPPDDS